VTADWTAQAQAGVGRWLEAQHTWWTQVLGGAPGAEGGPSAEAARAAVEAWLEANYRVVDAQAKALLGALGESAGTDAETVLRQWTDAQRELWKDWLAAAGGVAGAPGSPASPEAGRALVEALREASEHLIRSQAEWAEAWTGAEADSGRQGGP
jgi:hypothetical protein